LLILECLVLASLIYRGVGTCFSFSLCAHLCASAHLCMYLWLFIYVSVPLCVCLCLEACTCVCVHSSGHRLRVYWQVLDEICWVHTHTHTHTHTHAPVFSPMRQETKDSTVKLSPGPCFPANPGSAAILPLLFWLSSWGLQAAGLGSG
jgi:hypothetical protein